MYMQKYVRYIFGGFEGSQLVQKMSTTFQISEKFSDMYVHINAYYLKNAVLCNVMPDLYFVV